MGLRKVRISSELIANLIKGQIRGPVLSSAPNDLRVLGMNVDGDYAVPEFFCESSEWPLDDPIPQFTPVMTERRSR